MTESLKQKIEKITGRHIKMIDASEFEQSGGSVRCMVLDIRT
jgi:N-dimethylarginine dimethylaminohydrolase